MIPRKYIFYPILFISIAIMTFFGLQAPGDTGGQLLNDRSGQIVGADLLHAPGFVVPYGLTGANQVVAVADSGLDKGSVNDIHPDLANEPGKKPKIFMLRSVAGRQVADDPLGHGTHMVGTIAGSGVSSQGKFMGLAPDSGIYFQGLLNQEGKIVAPTDLDKIFLPAYQAGARIHVNAWGNSGNAYSLNAKKTDQFMRSHPNFLVIFGAGNSGPGAGTLTNEANSKNALVVGASISPRPALDFSSGDTLSTAKFSSRGPTKDNRIKPELLAPGTSIISTRSSLIEGNLPGFPQYSLMQGSSMSAAVAAGSAALLREYLQKEEGLPDPMSATVKAALINGARTSAVGPSKENFGVLDLAGTVMALKENSMELVEEKQGLTEGLVNKYTYAVENPDAPLKVTLTWNDPPAQGSSEKSLINNLDLLVTSPDGSKHMGNGFIYEVPDNINNTEQVYIEKPQKGVYTIEVKAESIIGNAQDYSLVFGQPLASGIVKNVNTAGEIEIYGQQNISPSGRTLHYFLNGEKTGELKDLSGHRVYYNQNSLYVVGRQWTPESAQTRDGIGGRVWHQSAQDGQEGGYYQNPQTEKGITVNGQYRESTSDLPQGVGLKASLDGVTQTISSLIADFEVVKGFVNRVVTGIDEKIKSIELFQSNRVYQVSPEASYTYNDSYVSTDPVETVFGAENLTGALKVMSGQQVALVTPKTSNLVSSILMDRNIISGFITEINSLTGSISIGGEEPFKILPGSEIQKDQSTSEISTLTKGDYVVAVVLPDSKNILGIAAYSNVVYGKVLFTSLNDNSIYISDINNSFRELKLSPQTQVKRWGLNTNITTLTSGTWVRATLTPDGDQVLRVDVAEMLEDATETISQVDGQHLYTSTGDRYRISSTFTDVSKDGLPITAQDLKPGEVITVVSLLAPSPYNKVPVAIRAASDNRAPKPAFMAVIRQENDDSFITGYTDGDILYVWYQDGKHEEIQLNADHKSFNGKLNFNEYQDTIKIVSVNRTTGAVAGKTLEKQSIYTRQFTDISGHWAENTIKKASVGGAMAGNSDGTFRPDDAVTIAQLYRIQSNITGKSATTMGSGDSIGRAAFMVVLKDMFEDAFIEDKILPLPFTDLNSVSREEREAIEWAYSLGIIQGRTYDRFYPQRFLTRAETAVIIHNVFEMLALF